jgi:hypothetical protein
MSRLSFGAFSAGTLVVVDLILIMSGCQAGTSEFPVATSSALTESAPALAGPAPALVNVTPVIATPADFKAARLRRVSPDRVKAATAADLAAAPKVTQ